MFGTPPNKGLGMLLVLPVLSCTPRSHSVEYLATCPTEYSCSNDKLKWYWQLLASKLFFYTVIVQETQPVFVSL